MDLELRHLRAFVAVADEGGFTDAAIALGISQASVSRTLASLEAVLGAELIRRTTRTMSLTDAGLRLLPEARATLRAAGQAYAAVREEERPLLVGHSWSALGALTTPVLRGWAARHPGTPLELRRHNERTSGLADARVDVAIVRHRLPEGHYTSVIVGREPRVCAVAADDPLAERSELMLADLLDLVVAVDRQTGTTGPSLWRDAGLDRSPRFVWTGDVDEWVDRISAGGLVGVTATSTSHQYPRAGVRYLPLVGAAPLTVSLAWHTAREHPLTPELVEHLRSAYRDAA
ncbi:LysR family transcriptional regulator [Amnibacterium flavum]|nr:LysR family transcriptional regulator [Amnibacterium flavum]